MKIRLLALTLLLVTSISLRASDQDDFAAVKAADQRRIAATIASTTAELAKLLSDDLSYGQSDGHVQTKAQLLSAIAGSAYRYQSVVLAESGFQAVAPGVVAMNGVSQLSATNRDQKVTFRIRFLALWRKETGEWKLLAYQSSQIPAR